MSTLLLMIRRFLFRLFPPVVSLIGRLYMRLCGCSVPGNAKIYGLPRLLRMEGKLRIGNNVFLCSMPSVSPSGQEFSRCSFSADRGASIDIGDDTSIVGSAIHASSSVTLGKRVMIAPGCRIVDTDFHAVDAVPHVHHADTNPQPIRIEDDVWLCTQVMVCKGVRIGHGSVIGAKSLVTSDIPPMVLAGGIPAKVIRPLAVGDHPSASV